MQDTFRKSVIVRFVKDALSDKEISVDEAKRRGILDMDKLTYKNTKTNALLTFQEAIDQGLLRADGGGLRKLHSVKEAKCYSITGAIDPFSKQQV